jgi:hypothetical protein
MYTGLGVTSDPRTFWNAVGIGRANLLTSNGITNSGVTISTTYTDAFRNVPPANALLGDRIICGGGGAAGSSLCFGR